MQLNAADIAQKRIDLGLTQKEFAAALGMGSSGERTVRRWESGDTSPTAAECAFIASLDAGAPFDQGERSDAPFYLLRSLRGHRRYTNAVPGAWR